MTGTPRLCRAAVAGLTAVLLVLPSACSTTTEGQPSAVTTPLTDRPSSDTTVARYETLQTEVRHAVSTVAPTVVWEQRREGGRSLCAAGEVGDGGQIVTLPRWGAPGGIPDEQWPAVVTAVTAVAAPYAFGDLFAVVNRPSDHQIQLRGPYGATIDLGTAVNVVLTVTTGCHPTS